MGPITAAKEARNRAEPTDHLHNISSRKNKALDRRIHMTCGVESSRLGRRVGDQVSVFGVQGVIHADHKGHGKSTDTTSCNVPSTYKITNLRGLKERTGKSVKQITKHASAARLQAPKTIRRSHRLTVT